MRRRKFIQAAALTGFALAVGLNSGATGLPIAGVSDIKTTSPSRRFTGPAGGCTETNFTIFARGPRGRDPFGLGR